MVLPLEKPRFALKPKMVPVCLCGALLRLMLVTRTNQNQLRGALCGTTLAPDPLGLFPLNCVSINSSPSDPAK